MVPCRLFLIFASDEPIAAIIRRGPSGWVQLIYWQTRRDEFVDGSWFKGRIDPTKCDLSPDGTLFLAFCYKGSLLRTTYKDSWTAVSRFPWLQALSLWPSGTTYGGGGRFLSNRSVVLRTGFDEGTHKDHPATGLDVTIGSPDLQRSTEAVEGAEFSGVDQAGHIVFCRGGKLFRRAAAGDVELMDFNDRKPAPEPPPHWAGRPLKPYSRKDSRKLRKKLRDFRPIADDHSR